MIVWDLTAIRNGETYRGYTFWKREVWGMPASSTTGTWGAYTSGASPAWFTGKTPEELVKQIDEAYEELPVPVY